jgi:hypothetical protein
MNNGVYPWWRWSIAYLVIVPSAVVAYMTLGTPGLVVPGAILVAVGFYLTVETLVYYPQRLNNGIIIASTPVLAWGASLGAFPDTVQSTEFYKAMSQILPVLLLAFSLEKRREYHTEAGPDYLQRFSTIFVLLILLAALTITLWALAYDDPRLPFADVVIAALVATVLALVLSLISPPPIESRTNIDDAAD